MSNQNDSLPLKRAIELPPSLAATAANLNERFQGTFRGDRADRRRAATPQYWCDCMDPSAGGRLTLTSGG